MLDVYTLTVPRQQQGQNRLRRVLPFDGPNRAASRHHPRITCRRVHTSKVHSRTDCVSASNRIDPHPSSSVHQAAGRRAPFSFRAMPSLSCSPCDPACPSTTWSAGPAISSSPAPADSVPAAISAPVAATVVGFDEEAVIFSVAWLNAGTLAVVSFPRGFPAAALSETDAGVKRVASGETDDCCCDNDGGGDGGGGGDDSGQKLHERHLPAHGCQVSGGCTCGHTTAAADGRASTVGAFGRACRRARSHTSLAMALIELSLAK